MALEGEERLVASDQELDMSGLGEREEVVVVRVGGDLDLGEFFDDDGQVAKLVYEASCKGCAEPSTDFRVTSDSGDLVELFDAGDQIEFAAAPQGEDLRGRGSGGHQGTQENVGVDHHAHRLLSVAFSARSAFFFAYPRDRLIDQVLKVIGRNVGERFADLIDSLIEQAPFDGVLDKFGEGAFFEAASAEVGAQGEVGILGPDNG